MKRPLTLVVLSIFYFLLHSCGDAGSQQESPTGSNVVNDNWEQLSDSLEKLGLKYTAELQGVLASHLMKAVKDSGVSYALQFCNVNAYPFTDSISKKYGVTISRVSHKPRNPDNQADEFEQLMIDQYTTQRSDPDGLQPVVKASENEYTYYQPITMFAPLCLKCHGKPGTDIAEADLATIHKLYPNDQATGFNLTEIRGLWKVQFPKTAL